MSDLFLSLIKTGNYIGIKINVEGYTEKLQINAGIEAGLDDDHDICYDDSQDCTSLLQMQIKN